jgi:hypothetical protein
MDTAAKSRLEEIIAFTKAAAEKEKTAKQTKTDQITASDIRAAVSADLRSMYRAIETRINGLQETANANLSNTDAILKATGELKSGTNDLISKVSNVTDVTDKIASTTQSYRDVLVARQTPSHKATADPYIAQTRGPRVSPISKRERERIKDPKTRIKRGSRRTSERARKWYAERGNE